MWRGARLVASRRSYLEVYSLTRSRGQVRWKKSIFHKYDQLRTKSWNPNFILPDLDPMCTVPVVDEWTKAAKDLDGGWSAVAEAPLVGHLLLRYTEQHGRCRTLDVCSGAGTILNGLALRNCQAMTAIDPCLNRVAVSDMGMATRHRHLSNIQILQHNLNDHLPFKDQSYELITCNYGLPQFKKPLRLFKEARRLLSSTGIFAFSTFASPPKSLALSLLRASLEAKGTPEAVAALDRVFKFGQAPVLRRALKKVGFPESHTSIRSIPGVWRVRTPEGLFEMLQGSPALEPVFEPLSKDQRSAVQADLAERLLADAAKRDSSVQRATDGSIFIPQSAIIGQCYRKDPGVVPNYHKVATKETWRGSYSEAKEQDESDEEEDEEEEEYETDDEEDEVEENVVEEKKETAEKKTPEESQAKAPETEVEVTAEPIDKKDTKEGKS